MSTSRGNKVQRKDRMKQSSATTGQEQRKNLECFKNGKFIVTRKVKQSTLIIIFFMFSLRKLHLQTPTCIYGCNG